MSIHLESIHALRMAYDEKNPIECQAIDAELERRHQASLRRERCNLVANKVGGWA